MERRVRHLGHRSQWSRVLLRLFAGITLLSGAVGCGHDGGQERQDRLNLEDFAYTDYTDIEIPTAEFPESRPELRIGALQRSEGHVFGLIEDVALDSRGRIYVFDSRLQGVSMFDGNGSLISVSGREGRGPGEFRIPEALLVTPDDRLLTLDPGNARIEFYSIEDDSLALSGATRLEFNAFHFCHLGKRTFLLGIHEGNIIHEISEDGDLVRSFGEPYEATEVEGWFRMVLQRRMSDGRIVCSGSPERIIYLPYSFPAVVAFTLDGTKVWTTRLPHYSQLRVRMTERGSMQFVPDPETGCQSIAERLLILDDNLALAQVGAQCMIESDAPIWIDSHFITIDSGTLVASTDTMPLIAAVRGDLIYSWSNEPYPYLAVTRGRISQEP